ncbi:hypothetical protein ACHAPO_011730 [Fusarium lateritium]
MADQVRDQVRIQDFKQRFQAAYDHAISEKEKAEKAYNEEKEMGITQDPFNQWVAMNYPSYSAAENQYRGARAAYEAALQNGDTAGFQAWRDKLKQTAMDNIGPHGPDYSTLVGPDE